MQFFIIFSSLFFFFFCLEIIRITAYEVKVWSFLMQAENSIDE